VWLGPERSFLNADFAGTMGLFPDSPYTAIWREHVLASICSFRMVNTGSRAFEFRIEAAT
jgi:hypothetical protein